MLQESIKKLVQYGINTGLTPECERIYTTNLLLDVMKEDEYTDPDCDLSDIVLEDVLKDLLDAAVEKGLIEDSVTRQHGTSIVDHHVGDCAGKICRRIQKVTTGSHRLFL